MRDVMIGVDPHKGSHAATMLDRAERELRRIKVRASSRQVGELLEWADGVRPRTWAVESAGGMGYLLAQQLVAAGETVVDVPATLASRVRVLASGQSTKSDIDDARSVAVAALHAPSLARVRAGCGSHHGVSVAGQGSQRSGAVAEQAVLPLARLGGRRLPLCHESHDRAGQHAELADQVVLDCHRSGYLVTLSEPRACERARSAPHRLA